MKRIVATLMVLVALAGCTPAAGTTTTPSAPSATIIVFAAASLTETFTRLGAQFEVAHPGTRVVFSFGPSSTLATQINQGAPADVFASASTKNMNDVVTAGHAAHPTIFARNVLTVAVPVTNPAGVTSLADLAGSSVKVALCQAAVPCGMLADRVLANASLAVTPVTREADVKAVLTKVTLGEVDAGLVYVTDVKAAGNKVRGIEIPAEVNESTDYPIATLTASSHRADGQAFTDYVLSREAEQVFTEAGFTAPR